MASISSSGERAASASTEGQNFRGPFAIMTSLFFLWGFMTVFNDILIPRFKEAFTLNYFQAMLVQFAFFGAYFVGSLIYFLISATQGDPIAKLGYKNGVVIGLLISATGSALFWPAAGAASYPMFLTALFIVGLGFAMLQIAANPYVTILGPEKTASSRLNLAQGFNSIGTTIGPLIGGWLIFQYFATSGAHGADSVKVPYLAFCIIFLILAAVFFFIHLPHVGEGKIEPGAGALKFPHVVLGVIAIFMYVGGEVTVGSAIINFLGQPTVAGLSELEASKYVAIYWGGLMIGRFMGAVELSEMKKANKQVALIVIPLLAYLLLWIAKSAPLDALHGKGDASVFSLWKDAFIANGAVFKIYLPFIGLCWLLFQFGRSKAGRTLVIFSATVVALLLTAILVGGKVAMWCVVAIGLFTSIGWSNTFSLALEGTGIYKSQVSSLLVMAILGGAVLPPIQGKIADLTGNLQLSFIVPLIAYAYVAFYGAKGHRIGRAVKSDT
ncbi:MAG TPA: sugar MFS transporter [Verrucomicrobiae bacterium]|nr:sugar MFS transporter [Verrucomicrobiae bacterium]